MNLSCQATHRTQCGIYSSIIMNKRLNMWLRSAFRPKWMSWGNQGNGDQREDWRLVFQSPGPSE